MTSLNDIVHRWNFFAGATIEVYVCRNEHEKGEPCERELMGAEEIVLLIEQLRARVRELEQWMIYKQK